MGAEALAFLHQEGEHAEAPCPDLILLAWNGRGKHDRALLGVLKADANLRVIPVVVLSASRDKQDILAAYELDAASYIVKPSVFSEMCRVMEVVLWYWFDVVTLPPTHRSPSGRCEHSLTGKPVPTCLDR